MSMKLKAVCLGLLAILATSALAVVNASAEEASGHFVSEKAHTILSGTEVKPNHQVKFSADGTTPIECTKVTYSGTTNATTVESVTITPHYTECITENGSTPHNVTVNMNGCKYTFTVNTKAATTHHTVHVVGCTKPIEIIHPNCTMTVPQQTPTGGGVVYETDTTPGGKHSITANITVTGIHAQFHGGICIFLGTAHQATMTGAATLSGTDTEGEEVGITATSTH